MLREREGPHVSHKCSNEAGASNKSSLTCVNKEDLISMLQVSSDQTSNIFSSNTYSCLKSSLILSAFFSADYFNNSTFQETFRETCQQNVDNELNTNILCKFLFIVLQT